MVITKIAIIYYHNFIYRWDFTWSENFGFTDPLTNTWRPKKFSEFGTKHIDNWNGDTTGVDLILALETKNAFDGSGPRQDGYAPGQNGIMSFTPLQDYWNIEN